MRKYNTYIVKQQLIGTSSESYQAKSYVEAICNLEIIKNLFEIIGFVISKYKISNVFPKLLLFKLYGRALHDEYRRLKAIITHYC